MWSHYAGFLPPAECRWDVGPTYYSPDVPIIHHCLPLPPSYSGGCLEHGPQSVTACMCAHAWLYVHLPIFPPFFLLGVNSSCPFLCTFIHIQYIYVCVLHRYRSICLSNPCHVSLSKSVVCAILIRVRSIVPNNHSHSQRASFSPPVFDKLYKTSWIIHVWVVDVSKTPLSQPTLLWYRWCGSGGPLIIPAAHYLLIICVPLLPLQQN